MTRNRVLVIGVDGVDWASLIVGLQDRRLPRLAALAARGAAMPLRALPPFEGPASWTTIATGQPPDRHGVVRWAEGWAGGLRPATRESWTASPLWARAAQGGVATASVGWPCSAPGDSWSGTHVDDGYARIDGDDFAHWALPLHCAPAPLREELREVRVHPRDIDTTALAPFFDALDDPRATAVRYALASAATVRAAARVVLTRDDWDLALVHFSWLGDLRRFDGGEKMATAAWQFLDALIGALIDQVPDAAIVLTSPGGREGVGTLIMAAPKIAQVVPGIVAQTIDVAPSVLALLGLRDPTLPGRVLGCVPNTPRIDLPPAPAIAQVEHDRSMLANVVAAGFVTPPGPPGQWQADGWAMLAEALVARDPASAEALARVALERAPNCIAALRALASAAIGSGRHEAITEIADRLDTVAPGHAWASLARGAAHVLAGKVGAAAPLLRHAESADDIETLLRVGAAWMIGGRLVDAERIFARVAASAPGLPAAELGLALVAAELRDFAQAEARLRAVLASDPGHVAAWRQLIDVLERSGRKREAAAARVALDVAAA